MIEDLPGPEIEWEEGEEDGDGYPPPGPWDEPEELPEK